MEPTKTNNKIEEEHLLNFVVNSLNDELAINLGEDVEVTTETLHEFLAEEFQPRRGEQGGTRLQLLNNIADQTIDRFSITERKRTTALSLTLVRG